MTGLRVNRSLVIPEAEIELRFTPSGGPGGQHANRSSTRVELIWNVDSSAVLTARQRQRIHARLKKRIDSGGDLHLSSDRFRSQTRNRDDVTRRLVDLVREALVPTKRRVPTAPSAGSKERRLQDKKRRGEIKRARRAPSLD